MPVVTRPSETAPPKSTSTMVTRSHAREGRGISVAAEVQIEPEIETRPEQEIATCEGGLGAARPFATDTANMFTFVDKPETVAAHTSQEVTKTSLFTTSQTSPHTDRDPPPHTGSQHGIIFSAGNMSDTSADISRADASLPHCLITVMSRLLVRLRQPVHRFAKRRLYRCLRRRGSRLLQQAEVLLMSQPRDQLPWSANRITQSILRRIIHAWRQWYAHNQPWQSDDVTTVTIQSLRMSHARLWEESSKLVVHTTYTTPNIGCSSLLTRDTVARDMASRLVSSVRQSVLPHVTETVGVRLTARLADRPEFVVLRCRSRTPDKAVRSPRLRRPLDIAIPGSSG